MIDRIRPITLIVNGKALLVAALAVLSTYACLQLDIKGDFPLTLIATAVVFPIVFSINSAYKRRESVLDDYSLIKAHGRAIYFASRGWLTETLHVLTAAGACWEICFAPPASSAPRQDRK